MESNVCNKTDSNRMGWIDSLRLIAMFIIYATHFINAFCPEYFSLWQTFPTSLLLSGVTGKLGVALFGVILGYFAFLSKESDTTRYVLKRYVFFAISGLIINLLYAFAGWFLSGFTVHSIMSVIKESLKLGKNIFATYWCIPSFFAASIISYLNGKSNASVIVVIMEIFIFFVCGQIWIAVCLIGNIVAKCEVTGCFGFLKHRVVRIFLWIVLFFAIKIPESVIAYMANGFCCGIMIMLIMRGNFVKKILNNRFTAIIGEKGMGVFLLHPILYRILGPVLFNCFSSIPYHYAFCITFVMCFIAVVAASFPLVWFINKATTLVTNSVITVKNFCKKRILKYC